MASIGLKSFKYSPLNSDGVTYVAVKTLAGAIECKVTIDTSDATLYADDKVKEYIQMFKSGSITAGIDDDNDTIFAEVLGKTIDPGTGVVTSNSEDTPPYEGFGHVVPKMVNGAKKYKVEFFPKVRFKPFVADTKTKSDKLEFTNPSVEATIFENDNGDWEKHGVYDSESAADAALLAMFTQSAVTLDITAQPIDETVTAGSITGSLSVTATASSGSATYQWYSASSYSNSEGSAIAGATSASYTIPTTLAHTDSPKYYYCIVGHASAPSIVSNVAKVTINAA
jgi:phi13 family phage major tail protein